MPIVGQNMLIFLGWGRVIVCYVRQQMDGYGWIVDGRTVLNTGRGGDAAWEELAAGLPEARSAAEYAPLVKGRTIGAGIWECLPWEGELP